MINLSIDFSIKADKQQTSPFVMMGNALIANADMENVGITLAPQYAKINIKNKAAGSETNGLFISSVQLKNVPESAYPLLMIIVRRHRVLSTMR